MGAEFNSLSIKYYDIVENLAEVKLYNINHFALTHLASHFIIEGDYQAD